MNELCGLTVDYEYSLHHEFSNAITNEDIESVKSIKKYVFSHQNPTDISMMKNVTNITNGESLQNVRVKYLLNSIDKGETLHKQFEEKRFIYIYIHIYIYIYM